MAKALLFFFFTLFSASFATTTFSKTKYPPYVPKQEKLTHLHFYLHDITFGKNISAVKVAEAANTSATSFGQLFVADDPLTVTPDLNSSLVGRCQGTYAFTSLSEFSMSVVFNLIFTDKMYNGSSITFVGQDNAALPVRELPILGGTGVFRYTRGYVQFRTFQFDPKTGNVILDVNVYALH